MEGRAHMKRACVFLFYDADGIVDRYIEYYLQALKTVSDYLLVVVNGKLTVEGRKTFAALADDFFVRENVGYDAAGFKAGIEYIGWEELENYDELIITNSSIYGPIYPLKDSFARMDATECDFWGMFTSYGERNMKAWFGVPLKWGYRPDAILTNFHVYKTTVLHSYEFRHHWDTLPQIKTYYEACVYHEMTISKTLMDAGFVAAAMDQMAFQGVCPSPTVYAALDMVVKYHIPLVRKKAFFDPNGSLDYCTDQPREIMKFLEEHTNYPCDLIWENLLRTTNQYDLKNWFNWNTILPRDYVRYQPALRKVAVIFHTYYTDIIEQYLHNIASFPHGTHFYFTADTKEKLETLKEFMVPYQGRYEMEFRPVENRGRDVSALLVACRDVVLEGNYDLICFMHDKKGIRYKSSWSCTGKTCSDCCFENIAPSVDYVNNVIELFSKNPRLGIAVPPPPQNEHYYKVIGGSWGRDTNYSHTEKILRELGITVPLDRMKPPVAPYGTVFWFRPDALLPLFEKEWRYEDFDSEPMQSDGTVIHAVERIYSLIAQGKGYYPNVIMSNVYAEQEVTRMTEIAHIYVNFILEFIEQEPQLLSQSTARMKQLLQGKAGAASVRHMPKQLKTIYAAKPALSTHSKRGPVKGFIRGICPIGLWNLMRRAKCAATGGVYTEPRVERGPIKTIARACTPRYLWDQLRKGKCRENGWVFVPDD